MKIIISETVYNKKEIEIDLPYYFSDFYMDDTASEIEYGRIEEKQCVRIKEKKDVNANTTGFEIITEHYGSLYNSNFNESYFTSVNGKSSKEAFESAKKEAIDFLNNL